MFIILEAQVVEVVVLVRNLRWRKQSESLGRSEKPEPLRARPPWLGPRAPGPPWGPWA
jgi:hypothetical protein